MKKKNRIGEKLTYILCKHKHIWSLCRVQRCINKPNDVKMNRNEIIATFETGSILKEKQSEKSITEVNHSSFTLIYFGWLVFGGHLIKSIEIQFGHICLIFGSVYMFFVCLEIESKSIQNTTNVIEPGCKICTWASGCW